MNAKQRILKRLSEGPAPLYELREPGIGGCSADVRLRELRRDHKLPIRWYYKDKRKNLKGLEDAPKSKTTIYYLDIPPDCYVNYISLKIELIPQAKICL